MTDSPNVQAKQVDGAVIEKRLVCLKLTCLSKEGLSTEI